MGGKKKNTNSSLGKQLIKKAQGSGYKKDANATDFLHVTNSFAY